VYTTKTTRNTPKLMYEDSVVSVSGLMATGDTTIKKTSQFAIPQGWFGN